MSPTRWAQDGPQADRYRWRFFTLLNGFRKNGFAWGRVILLTGLIPSHLKNCFLVQPCYTLSPEICFWFSTTIRMEVQTAVRLRPFLTTELIKAWDVCRSCEIIQVAQVYSFFYYIVISVWKDDWNMNIWRKMFVGYTYTSFPTMEQWKKPWLFRVQKGLYYWVMLGLQLIIRIPIKQPLFHGKSPARFFFLWLASEGSSSLSPNWERQSSSSSSHVISCVEVRRKCFDWDGLLGAWNRGGGVGLHASDD